MKKKLIGAVLFMTLCLCSCSRLKEDPDQKSESTVNQKEKEEEKLEERAEQEVPQGDSLEDVVIAIDPGHGGKFAGAVYDNRLEKDLVLTIGKEVKNYLESNYDQVKVVLVREEDEPLSNDLKTDLELRTEFAKDINADAYVSLHFNASDGHTQSGAMVFISNQKSVHDACEELGNNILDELEQLGIYNNGTRTRDSNDTVDAEGKPMDYYAVNRHCAAYDIPGIIVEHCFLDHPTDETFIDSEEDLIALAHADAKGIATYFGLPKKQ